MDFIEVTGKTVDAAVFNGLQQLGVSIDEVRIETLQTETKGILGIGAKPAKVRLTLKAPEEIIVPDFEAETKAARGERAAGYNRSDVRRGNDRRYGKNRSGRGGREYISKRAADTESAADNKNAAASEVGNGMQESDTADKNIQPSFAGAEIKTEDAAPDDTINITRLTEKVEYSEEAALNNPAADFIRGLTERMGIEAKILAFTDEKSIRLRIDGEYMGFLIGHRGETLDAIQYLTSLIVNKNRKENGYKRVTVNTNDYREKREAALIRLAKRVGEQVRLTGRPRMLEPMNPYERRVLHYTLQSNPYVSTHSEGEEPNRRVVIAPVKRR